MRSEGLSVYVHIPFCVRKCLYCDFLSQAFDERKAEAYLKAVLCEIRLAGSFYGKQRVRTVYFGGGTPSVVPAFHIEKILETLKEEFSFNEDCEISLEINPKTADEEAVRTYLFAGVNRFSLGMQSASDPELKALGRVHDNGDLLEAFGLLRGLGADNINLDIMTGIPHQDMDSLKKTLDEAVSLKCDHISAYALILEPGTPFFEQGRDKLDLCDEDTEMEMYEYTVDFLEANGYQRYEISNYSRPGRKCLHNLSYWNCDDYLGFGCAAASRIKNTRFTNIKDIDAYIMSPVKNRSEELTLDDEELMSEFFFMGMRKTEGVSVKTFRERFGRSIFGVYGDRLEKHIRQGLIIKDGDRLRFSRRGLDVSNIILSDFVS